MLTINKATGMLIGLAIGDALGAPLEFRPARNPDNYLKRYTKGGVYSMDIGEWTDDTAMALAMAESIIHYGMFDANDIMDNFVAWYQEGKFVPRGSCFDIGVATSQALDRYMLDPESPYKGDPSPMRASNGALMRIAPVVIAARNKEELFTMAVQQTILTHASPLCIQYSVMLAEELYHANPLQKYKEHRHDPDLKPESIASSGYVVDTYTAAMWAFQSTNNFEDCVIAAVNRGDDADTVGAVAGMIAGAHYGYTKIPKHFTDDLMWHDRLFSAAVKLHRR